MIWTSRFLFLHPLTTMGVDLAEFIAARSNEPDEETCAPIRIRPVLPWG